MKRGAVGVVSVASNLIPAEVKSLVDAARKRDWTKAEELHGKYASVFRDLFIESNPGPVKAAMAASVAAPAAARNAKRCILPFRRLICPHDQAPSFLVPGPHVNASMCLVSSGKGEKIRALSTRTGTVLWDLLHCRRYGKGRSRLSRNRMVALD
jgi:hypothetical protein